MRTHKIFVARKLSEKQSTIDCLGRKLTNRGLKYQEDETNWKEKRTRTP
jgi:mannitol/fructose-specific phosphotransferase system IIA component